MFNTLPFVHQWLKEISEYNSNCDHSRTTNTETLYVPPNNYPEHAAIPSMKESLIADSNIDLLKANKLATLKLPASKIQTLCCANETCLTCTEGIQHWDSSCKSNASFTCLMWELTRDPMKRTQLDALPVTSLNSYKEFIRQRKTVSSTARENMLKVVDTLAEMKRRSQSIHRSNVHLQQPRGDSTIVFTSPDKVFESGCQYLELKNARKGSTFLSMTENKCTSGKDEIDYSLKTNSSQVHPQNVMMLEANCSPKQISSSLTWGALREHNKENQPQLRSDLSNCFVYTDKHHAHQTLVDAHATSAQKIYLNGLNKQTLLCVDRNESNILQPIVGNETNKKNLCKELNGMTRGKESNVEYYSCGSTEKVKNKLASYSSHHLERGSSGESSIRAEFMSGGKFQSSATGTEDESKQEFSYDNSSQSIPFSCTNPLEVGNAIVNEEEEESEEELDEEPLSQQTSSSSSIQSLESSSIHEINRPTFPQQISKRELDGGSAQFNFQDMSNSSVKHLKLPSLLEHSLGGAKNDSDSSDGSLVIRYNKKQKLRSNNCIGPGSYQRQVKMPSLVDICLEIASTASSPTKILEPDLSLLAQNVHSAMKDLLDIPDVMEHDTQSQCESSINSDNMTNTVFPHNSRPLDKFNRGKDSTGTTRCEQASSATVFENIPTKTLCSSHECEDQCSFSSTQSSVHSLPEVASQHIALDILTSLQILE